MLPSLIIAFHMCRLNPAQMCILSFCNATYIILSTLPLQVSMCGISFLILFMGNFFTTVAVVRHKLKSKGQTKPKDQWCGEEAQKLIQLVLFIAVSADHVYYYGSFASISIKDNIQHMTIPINVFFFVASIVCVFKHLNSKCFNLMSWKWNDFSLDFWME